jgi:DNA-binding response OmpR family regulator
MSRDYPHVLLIDFDGRWGEKLRKLLVRQRIKASVVSEREAAITFARNKPVLAALVGKDEPQVADLCRHLRKLGVETIFLLAPSNSASITAAIMQPGHGVLQRQTVDDPTSAISR